MSGALWRSQPLLNSAVIVHCISLKFWGTFVTSPLICLNGFVANTWYCFVCMEVIFLHSDFKQNLEDK